MRSQWRPSVLFLFLLPSFHLSFGRLSTQEVADLAEGRDVGPLGPAAGPSPSMPTAATSKSNLDPSPPTKDAPVDGKDGRPHAGPFVETNAERDRKKAKGSGEEDVVAATKPFSKDPTTGKEGGKIPETNDGVMDDPNRKGPKEGTRGTEGGISEKSKEKLAQEGDAAGPKPEKKPDPPKEAPPLPHSEQEIVGPTKDSTTKKGTTEEDEKPKEKELGGLEV